MIKVIKKKFITPSGYFFSNKALATLMLPLIVEQLLTILVGLCDSIMVASVGESAVSGVSLVDSCMLLLINIFAALATGGAVVAGQYMGLGNNKNANHAANQLVWFMTVISAIVTLIVYKCSELILTGIFGKIEPDVYSCAKTYLLIVTASVPFLSLYNAGAAIFRTMGNSRITMLVSVIMNIINVLGNAILIYGFKMGTEGVAIPTLISRIAAALIITILLLNENLPLHIKKTFKYIPNWKMIKRILYIGIPNGFENSMFQLGKILVLSLISTFGTYAIAANAVCNVIASFQIIGGMSSTLAMITVISRCVGAGDYEQAKYYARKIMKFAYAAIIITVLFTFALLPFIMSVYNLTQQTSAIASQIMIFHGICAMLIWVPSFNLPAVFRASADVKYSMIVSAASMWACRLVLSWVIGNMLGFGVFGVWIAMVLDWAVRSTFFIIHYKRGKWKGKKVI